MLRRDVVRAMFLGSIVCGSAGVSRSAAATGDATPLVYAYLAVNGGFAAYDVGTAALERKSDWLLGAQLGVGAAELVPMSIWGYDSYEPGMVLGQTLPAQLVAYPLLNWASEPPRYWQALAESAGFGLNWALTLTALGHGPNPRAATWFSITEIALFAPRAVGTAFLLSDFESDVPTVVGLGQTLWSAVLAVDGIVRLSTPAPEQRSRPPGLPTLRLAGAGPFPRAPGEQQALIVLGWPWL